jgi:hypothetical protein
MPGSITRVVIKGRARINAVRAGKVQMIYGGSKVVSLVYYRKFCSFWMRYTPAKMFRFFGKRLPAATFVVSISTNRLLSEFVGQ